MTRTHDTLTRTEIAAIRKRAGMTQEQFAHAIGVTVSTVNRWERGHYAPSRLAVQAMRRLDSDSKLEV